MNVSLYSFTVSPFLNHLDSLSKMLDKAEAHANEKKIDQSIFLSSRLFPDQFHFTRQIQVACDNAKGTTARLAGVEIPKHEDNEKTFAELRARIAKTIDFVKSFTPEQINAGETRSIDMQYMPGKSMLGVHYVSEYALPNFFFHAVTAYDILRHNGVMLGKTDFITKLTLK